MEAKAHITPEIQALVGQENVFEAGEPAMAFPGDALTCRGKVQRQVEEEGRNLAACRLWVENQEGKVLAEGEGLVEV